MSLRTFGCTVVRQGWRPIAGWSVASGVLVNTVVLPLHSGQTVDLVSFATLIGACAPLFAVRAWEKKHIPETA